MSEEAQATESGRSLARGVAAWAWARLRARGRTALDALKRSPADTFIAVVAIGLGFVTIAWPFWVARYPAMTDLPFHAAMTSAFRHWFDASYHFRDQFELHPLSVPYASSYVLGAILMLFLPAIPAVKVATAIMLSALPIGLAVLAWGMRKSPLLGMAALPFVWCDLTHWGFINYVSALGLFAMSVGLALRVVDHPSRRTQIALSATLVVLLFTHAFRFPLAVAGVVGAAIAVYPVTRRLRPLLPALVVPLVLFVAFWFSKSPALGGDVGPLTPHYERLSEIQGAVVNGFDRANLDLRRLGIDGTLTVTAVPEPAALALWLAGLGAIALRMRRAARST